MCCCCRYLISQGANVGVVNSEGETPLDIAEEEAMEELLQNEINRQGAVLQTLTCWLLSGSFLCEFLVLILNFSIVFKALNCLAPFNLSELLHHPTPTTALRLSDQLLLEVTKTKLKSGGDGAFTGAAPRLLLYIRTSQT